MKYLILKHQSVSSLCNFFAVKKTWATAVNKTWATAVNKTWAAAVTAV